MPSYIVPWRRGAHRVAGIALFKELLKSSRNLPIDEARRTALQNVVRNRFKSYKLVQSKRLLAIAWNAGYEALDLVDAAADGDTTSITQIESLLSATPSIFKEQPPLAPLERRARPKKPSIEPWKDPFYSIFTSRPREDLGGKERRVPTLVIGNGIPFLRVKKPQPRSLGIYIASKVKDRQRRMDQKLWLEDTLIPVAKQEDKWDEILEKVVGLPLEDRMEEKEEEVDEEEHRRLVSMMTRSWSQDSPSEDLSSQPRVLSGEDNGLHHAGKTVQELQDQKQPRGENRHQRAGKWVQECHSAHRRLTYFLTRDAQIFQEHYRKCQNLIEKEKLLAAKEKELRMLGQSNDTENT